MSLIDTVPCELFDAILCHAGPIGCAWDRSRVAAIRIQRLWRRVRLRDGVNVMYRYRWMRRWSAGVALADGMGGFVIQGDRRVIFDIDRRKVCIRVATG